MKTLVSQIAKWSKHPFAHDVALLQMGGIASKAIAFGTSLIFARLLGPEGYGFYSLVFALAGIVIIFHDFGASQGAVNLFAKARAEKNSTDERLILSFVLKILLFTLATTGLVTLIITPWLGLRFYGDLYLGQLATIVVATSAFTVMVPLLQIILQSLRKIKPLTVFETIHKALNSAVPIVLILSGYGVLGIVAGQFTAMLLMSVVAVWYYGVIRKSEALPKLAALFKEKLGWDTIKYYFSFGFQIAISKNIVKLNATVPLLILASVLPTNSGLGFYKIAFAYMSLPIFMLSPVSRLLNVQFPETEANNPSLVFKRFWQVTGISMAIATVLSVGAVLIGPYLITFFYGVEFAPSIPIMYGLAFYPLMASTGVGLGALFRTLHKMNAAIAINVITLVLLVPASFILIQNYSIVGLVVITLAFTLFPNLLSLLYFYTLSKKPLPNN